MYFAFVERDLVPCIWFIFSRAAELMIVYHLNFLVAFSVFVDSARYYIEP